MNPHESNTSSFKAVRTNDGDESFHRLSAPQFVQSSEGLRDTESDRCARIFWDQLKSRYTGSRDVVNRIVSRIDQLDRPLPKDVLPLSNVLLALSFRPSGRKLVERVIPTLSSTSIDPDSVLVQRVSKSTAPRAAELLRAQTYSELSTSLEALGESGFLHWLTNAQPAAGDQQQVLRDYLRPDHAPRTLKLASYNVWGLPWLAGGRCPERYTHITAALRRSDFDVVLLQEMWSKKTRPIAEASGYRFHVKLPSSYGLLGQSGLVTISKHPIIAQDFLAFDDRSGVERMIRKGILHTRIELPHKDVVDVFNLHLISPGEGIAKRFITHSHAEKLQAKQLDQAEAFVRSIATPGVPAIVMGDFNIADTSDLYRVISRKFGKDLYRAHFDLKQQLGETTTDQEVNGLTVDPAVNFWAKYLNEDPGRLDYAFTADRSLQTLGISAQREFLEKFVDNKEGSDHYGVSVKLSGL